MTFRVAVITLTTLAGVGFLSGRHAAFAQQTKTQWDGVYTEEQAKRGESVYAKECSSCHGAALDGTMGPPLAGGDFSANWNDLSLGELAERIRTTMPQQNPGSLSREQSAEIIAYMLQKNGAPVGQTELPAQTEALNGIKYKTQKP